MAVGFRFLAELVAKASRANFVRNVAVLAGGGVIAQALPVLLTPALTRLYSPSDLGTLALYTAFIGFAATGMTLGYSMAVVSARNDGEAADLVTVSVLIAIPASILGSLLLALLMGQGWLGFGDLHPLASLAMAASLLLTGIYTTLRYWLIRKGEYRIISVATVGQSIGRVTTQVLAGIAHAGWPGLISGEVIGRAAGLRQMWRGTWKDIGPHARSLDFGSLRSTASVYRKFPLYTAPSSLLNSLAMSLPVPLISGVFGLDAAGQFSIASRVLLLPLALVGASIGDVFHNRLSGLSMNAPDRALTFFYMVSGSLLLMGTIPMLVVTIFGETLWPTVLGEEWGTAGKVAAVITPWALAQLVVNPVSRVVAVYQGQELKLVFDILALLSVIAVMSLASSLNWTLINTCMVLSLTQAVAYGVYFVLLIRILKKHKYANVSEVHPAKSAANV